jgi:hypothetical protein
VPREGERETFESEGLKQGGRVEYPTEEALRFNQQHVHTQECPANDFVVTRVITKTWNESKINLSELKVSISLSNTDG